MRNPKLREPFLRAAGLMPPRPGSLARVLHLAMLPRGSPRRAASTRAPRATPMDERDFDGTGQAFAESLEALRSFIAERFPARRRSHRLGKPEKKGTRNFVLQVTTTSSTSLLQGPRT